MPRKPPFSIDFHVRRPRMNIEGGLAKTLGLYVHDTNRVHVFLGPIYDWVKKFQGDPPQEKLIRRAIIETIVHEELHSLIRLRGPNADVRGHRIISRMLAHLGMDWRY